VGDVEIRPVAVGRQHLVRPVEGADGEAPPMTFSTVMMSGSVSYMVWEPPNAKRKETISSKISGTVIVGSRREPLAEQLLAGDHLRAHGGRDEDAREVVILGVESVLGGRDVGER
jgi:hypothetical protein